MRADGPTILILVLGMVGLGGDDVGSLEKRLLDGGAQSLAIPRDLFPVWERNFRWCNRYFAV